MPCWTRAFVMISIFTIDSMKQGFVIQKIGFTNFLNNEHPRLVGLVPIFPLKETLEA